MKLLRVGEKGNEKPAAEGDKKEGDDKKTSDNKKPAEEKK